MLKRRNGGMVFRA